MYPNFICNLLELKFAANGNEISREFSGYGAVFNNVDDRGDIINPGAFSSFINDVKSGKQDWPAMLSQHGGPDKSAADMTPVGIWTDMSEDKKGLQLSGILADTPRGNELYTLMKMTPRPAIKDLSIGYITRDSAPASKASGARRILKAVDLGEISLVTWGSNKLASVTSVKSAADMTEREFEQFLRDSAGLSKKDAQTVISHGFRAVVDVRDSPSDELKAIYAALNRNISTF